MPLGGGGVWERTPGTRITNQGALVSAQVNDETDNLLAGINAKASLSGALGMTGLQLLFGDGTAALHGATVKQVQTGIVQVASAQAGTVDAIQLTFSPANTTWTAKERVVWTSGGANTITAPTISKDGGSSTKIIKSRSGAALGVGDLGVSGTVNEGYYNGTDVLFLGAATATAATTAQQLTGTSGSVASTPDSVAALWEAGADVSDGAAITIGEGGFFNLITSTTAITSFSITTDKAGRSFRVRFNTARTLTHNGTSLIIPGAANITTAVGDIAFMRSLGGGNVVVEFYSRASGAPIVGAGITVIRRQVFTASGTYTPHSSMEYCDVIVTGGGGGGGGGDNSGGVGGGGGAGGTSRKIISKAAIGVSQVVTIGAAGTAGIASGGGTGGTGGASSLGALAVGNGGVGGVGNNAVGGSAGGAGGTATTGDTNITGGQGGSGEGNVADAGVTLVVCGGHGGASFWGGGGYGGAHGSAGSAGVTYGSGGGGASSVNSSGNAGAAGAAGLIEITEHCSA